MAAGEDDRSHRDRESSETQHPDQGPSRPDHSAMAMEVGQYRCKDDQGDEGEGGLCDPPLVVVEGAVQLVDENTGERDRGGNSVKHPGVGDRLSRLGRSGHGADHTALGAA